MTGYTWDLAHLHWNCTKLISYWSCRSTVVQFYPQDQRSSIQTPAPSIPTVYHLYCTSCIKHILFLANGRLSRHLDIFLILDLQTFPLIWSAPLKLVEPVSDATTRLCEFWTVWLISMVKIQELFPSYTGTTKATIWQTEWAVMAVNYVQSHWSCRIVLSPNLRAVCKRLQRTLLGQLAMCVNDATTRLCEFWTCGNFNSASIWLIGIRRQVFLQLLSEMRSIYIITSA